MLTALLKRLAALATSAVVLTACAMPDVEQPIPEEIETIKARVDVSTQTMTVEINGQQHFEWDVSTARPGKSTPRGEFGAYHLSRHHRSSLYNNAPMPNAIFFNGHYAVHGTDQEHRLGTPASAGCVRVATENAALLFDLVEDHGKDVFEIEISDDSSS